MIFRSIICLCEDLLIFQFIAKIMKSAIPQFALYGEGRWIDNPDFVHIEDIEARSSDLGWKIKAHKHTQLMQILLLKSGTVQLQLDTEKRLLQGRWAIVIPTDTVHGFRFSPQTDGRVLTISDHLIQQDSSYNQEALKKGCLDFNLDHEEFTHLWQLITLLEHEFHHVKARKSELIAHLLDAILVLIRRHQAQQSDSQIAVEDQLLMKLKILVNQHLKDHWKLADYAKALNVSEKKLSRVTQEAYGKSVLQLTHEYLLLEAKRNLMYTQKSVEEIAYDLGFKDPGYFSRFFKRLENMSPGKYRSLSDLPAL